MSKDKKYLIWVDIKATLTLEVKAEKFYEARKKAEKLAENHMAINSLDEEFPKELKALIAYDSYYASGGEEIKENDWDLSINRYKEIVYEEIKYDAPSEIIQDIETLDNERNEALANLKKMLG